MFRFIWATKRRDKAAGNRDAAASSMIDHDNQWFDVKHLFLFYKIKLR